MSPNATHPQPTADAGTIWPPEEAGLFPDLTGNFWSDAGITSVLEAGDVVAGYELFCRHQPDVAIADLAVG